MRAALQVDGEYALEPVHPAERRNSNIGRAFIVEKSAKTFLPIILWTAMLRLG